MPISKKSKIQREHRKGDLAGTRAAVKPNGLPVKAPKPTSICANCRKEIVNTNLKQLEVHAETHDQKLWSKEKCWPKEFPAKAEESSEARLPKRLEDLVKRVEMDLTE